MIVNRLCKTEKKERKKIKPKPTYTLTGEQEDEMKW